MAGIYIHIPFCLQACHYCDFHFSTSTAQADQVVAAICSEIGLQKNYLTGETIETIYLGGGTPSMLSDTQLRQIFDTLNQHFNLAAAEELTLEANPDDLTPAKLEALKELGVNRLSIGIQSFDDRHLTFMNRSHSSEQAFNCIVLARKAGIENISIDLIYGVPHEDHLIWKRDLGAALDLDVPHLSAYCLTIEEKTVFGRWQKNGRLAPIDDQHAADQYEMLCDALAKAGYEQYEISNFSKPGWYSRHNTSYWQQKAYLGLGPSAHSYNGRSRQYNIANNALYTKAIARGEVPCTIEELDDSQKFNEYLLTTLRTKWGTNGRLALQSYGFDLFQEKQRELSVLQKEELLFVTDDTLYLTKKGKLLADEITARLMM